MSHFILIDQLRSFHGKTFLYFNIVIFLYLIGWILEIDFKISRSMKIFQYLFFAFINKKRTVPRVYASVRNNERKCSQGLLG